MKIRSYESKDLPSVIETYTTSIRCLASSYYSPEQLEAWAPRVIDPELWVQRIRDINPFVLELDGCAVAYADLQPNGYIDHFFVSGAHPGRGIGTMLMTHILEEARRLGLTELTSDVSRTAQGFYERFGFRVVEQRKPVRGGVEIPNARMRLELKVT